MTKQELKEKIKIPEWAIGCLIALNKTDYTNIKLPSIQPLKNIAQYYLDKKYLSDRQIRFVQKLLSQNINQITNLSIKPISIKISNKKKSTKNASVHDNKIKIQFHTAKNSPEFLKTIAQVKTLPNRKFVKEDKCWYTPICLESVTNLQKWGFTLDDELTKFVSSLIQKPTKPKDLTFDSRLFPYQKDGVVFIDFKNRVLLADQMGLGKTCQSLSWLKYKKEKRPVIIVCPAFLKDKWKNEILMWTDDTNIQILYGKIQNEKLTGDYIIINYDILQPSLIQEILIAIKNISDRKHQSPKITFNRLLREIKISKTLLISIDKKTNRNLSPGLLPKIEISLKEFIPLWKIKENNYEKIIEKLPEQVLDLIHDYFLDEIKTISWIYALLDYNPQVSIFDECHYLKNPKTIRAETAKKITQATDSLIMISGTPIENRPVEFFHILNMIQPDLFPSFWSYVQEYCDAHKGPFGWDFNGASNTKKLHKLLTDTVMIRRTKDEVLPDLPPKIYSILPFELQNKEEYIEAEQNIISWIQSNKGNQAADKASRATHLVKLGILRRLALQGMMHSNIKWIKNTVETDEKVIVVGVHKEPLRILQKTFPKISVKLDGETSKNKKQFVVDEFQNNDKIKIFLGQIKACGVGIDLFAASNVLFLELPWKPGELDQAADRAHRIGQTKSVNIWISAPKNTIYYYLAEILIQKQKTLNSILDGKEIEDETVLSELINKINQSY